MKFLSLILMSLSATAFASEYNLEAMSKCSPGKPIESSGTVEGGVDGDTVHVRTTSGTYSIRLLGMDTPETHFNGKSQGVWGERAAARAQELLPVGTLVNLEFSADPCDSHGRPLAFVHTKGMLVNLQMAKEGLAVNYCVAPTFEHCQEIGDATTAAIQNKTGMFSDPKVELPYDFRRRIGGNVQRSYVGNWTTHEVFSPGNQEKTPVGQRVFFYQREDVKAPFHIVN